MIIKIELIMLAQSRNEMSQNQKPILLHRRRNRYQNRQKLSISILSLFPDKINHQNCIKHRLKNKLPQKIHSNTSQDKDTISASSEKSTFAYSVLYKKSSEKEKKIFNRLKISNFTGIRKISHIIFKTQINQIIEKIERNALMNKYFFPKSQGKDIKSGRPFFKLSESCKISHLDLKLQTKYGRWDKLCANTPQKYRSSSINGSKIRSSSLNSTLKHNFRDKKLSLRKKDELQGWQWQQPKRFLTCYENDDFDSMM